MLTHHGKHRISWDLAARAKYQQWVGKSWEELKGSLRIYTHIQAEKSDDPCVWWVHTKPEELHTLSKSPGRSVNATLPPVCGRWAEALGKLCRKCCSPSPARCSLPAIITSATAEVSQPTCLFSSGCLAQPVSGLTRTLLNLVPRKGGDAEISTASG